MADSRSSRHQLATGLAADCIKVLALDADTSAISNSILQSIDCLGMRACHTDNCPIGIATREPALRWLDIYQGALTELMQIMECACGHDQMSKHRGFNYLGP